VNGWHGWFACCCHLKPLVCQQWASPKRPELRRSGDLLESHRPTPRHRLAPLPRGEALDARSSRRFRGDRPRFLSKTGPWIPPPPPRALLWANSSACALLVRGGVGGAGSQVFLKTFEISVTLSPLNKLSLFKAQGSSKFQIPVKKVKQVQLEVINPLNAFSLAL
jgi:hypothetical protein